MWRLQVLPKDGPPPLSHFPPVADPAMGCFAFGNWKPALSYFPDTSMVRLSTTVALPPTLRHCSRPPMMGLLGFGTSTRDVSGISWKEGQGMCPLHDSQRILKIPHITPSALYSIFLPAVSLPPHTHHHMPQTQVCPECIVQFSRNPGTDVSQPHRSAAEPALWQRPAGLPQNLGCQHLAVSLSDSVRRMHAPVCCFLSRWHYGCD